MDGAKGVPKTYQERIISDHGRGWTGDGSEMSRSWYGVGTYGILIVNKLQNLNERPFSEVFEKKESGFVRG